jgi:hypothetical protein
VCNNEFQRKISFIGNLVDKKLKTDFYLLFMGKIWDKEVLDSYRKRIEGKSKKIKKNTLQSHLLMKVQRKSTWPSQIASN